MMCLDFNRMQSFFFFLVPSEVLIHGAKWELFRIFGLSQIAQLPGIGQLTRAPRHLIETVILRLFLVPIYILCFFLLCVDFDFVCPIIVFLFLLRIWISCDNNLFKQRNQLRIRYRTENSIISFWPTSCMFSVVARCEA